MGFVLLDLNFEKPLLPNLDQFVLSRYRKNTMYVINQCIFAYKLFEDFCFFCFLSDILTTVGSKKIIQNLAFDVKFYAESDFIVRKIRKIFDNKYDTEYENYII